MNLIEILLPLANSFGEPFSHDLFEDVQKQLAKKFGGLTAFTRSPAEGTDVQNGKIEQDEIIILEIMTENIDGDWWKSYRYELEKAFEQREIIIRTHNITLL